MIHCEVLSLVCWLLLVFLGFFFFSLLNLHTYIPPPKKERGDRRRGYLLGQVGVYIHTYISVHIHTSVQHTLAAPRCCTYVPTYITPRPAVPISQRCTPRAVYTASSSPSPLPTALRFPHFLNLHHGRRRLHGTTGRGDPPLRRHMGQPQHGIPHLRPPSQRLALASIVVARVLGIRSFEPAVQRFAARWVQGFFPVATGAGAPLEEARDTCFGVQTGGRVA